VDQAVPDLPAAWLAWARRLARNGRGADSQVCLERALTRWPADVGLLEEAAGRAVSRRDWASVDRILPRSTGSPASSLSPRLLALRAWGCAQRGDRDGARADAAEALRRGAGDPMLLSTVGDALAAAGDLDGAAARWTESLYRLPSARAGSALRISLLVRLARLEDERNRPGDALRAWRLVLKADPTLDEARRRVIALGGSW
jgi:tetratricopeptide (TPR) repeat protein